MNESMLYSLMQLFAIMANINRGDMPLLAREFVENYLNQQFSKALAEKYLLIFDGFAERYMYVERNNRQKRISSYSVKIITICTKIVGELNTKQRFLIVLSLIRFSKYFSGTGLRGDDVTGPLSDAVETVATELQISKEEYESCSIFIKDKFYKVPSKGDLLVISDDPEFLTGEVRHLQKDGLNGQILVLRIQRAGIYLFQYIGGATLVSSGRYVFPKHVWIFPTGGSIKGDGFNPIYYSDIQSAYVQTRQQNVSLLARDLEYKFRNSDAGIKKFSFQCHSGQLVGIMGGSGAGKSTLLKVLNGSMVPTGGGVYINGYNLHRKSEELEGLIGYIPQDDLLIEELTVEQNLYFNARLCLDGMQKEEIQQEVEKLLQELDLYDARELKVGSPLNKFISGGQRKRLNIALELIREPHILFVDEPTSGLSSTDSENVVSLLKQQALKGKLVLSTIHQPSSELFKQFDQLLILDKGGYPVYSGNPVDGITYFKALAGRADADEHECKTCGNVDPNDMLNTIEARNVDEYGAYTARRRTSPQDWYVHFKEKIESKLKIRSEKRELPPSDFRVPSFPGQFGIFFKRNLLTKLSDSQYLTLSVIVPILLAVILGIFCKYSAGDELDSSAYVFSKNVNIPAYLFMCVIVALFLGMIISAEEIHRDRRIRVRESFLHLSRNAYLLSKVSFLLMVSALQMLLFVIIGNLILEIRGMLFPYWLILFSTAVFGNLLGLLISDGLKSAVAIYIVVPFVLVPQILLAGIIVPFDKFNKSLSSPQAVPVSGDVMASRWAYEALAVHQFMHNDYQENLFEAEMTESNILYELQFLIPEIIHRTEDAMNLLRRGSDERELKENLKTIRNGLNSIVLTGEYPHMDALETDSFSFISGEDLIRWLEKYRDILAGLRERVFAEKDVLMDSLVRAAGGQEAYLKLRRNSHNEKLATLVLNRDDLRKLELRNGVFIRRMDPAYAYPRYKNGRSHFYATVKLVGKHQFSTLFINLLAIWAMTLVLYVLLSFSALRRVLDFVEERRSRYKS